MFDLKSFRKKNKLKQDDVAECIGMDRARISRYETGKDQSVTITNLLLKHYPEIIEYELDDDESGMDFKKLYYEAKEMNRIKDEQYATLKKSLELIEKLINKDQ